MEPEILDGLINEYSKKAKEAVEQNNIELATYYVEEITFLLMMDNPKLRYVGGN